MHRRVPQGLQLVVQRAPGPAAAVHLLRPARERVARAQHRLPRGVEAIEAWQAQSMAVMFVTHSLYEAVFLSQRVLVMSSRPGRVVAEVAIDAPYPRPHAFRSSPAYLQACALLSQALEVSQAQSA